MSDLEKKACECGTVDCAAQEMLDIAKEIGFRTTFDRAKAQEPRCNFGNTGICCRICLQGPCRIIPKKPGANKGICGASDFTVVSRNVVRYIAGGTAAHSDHGRHIAETLLHVAEGKLKDYQITDVNKLMQVAQKIGVETEGRAVNEIGKDVAMAALTEFGRMGEGDCAWITSTVTDGRVEKFHDTDIMPTNINLSIAQLLHQTHAGNDADPVNIIFGGLKTALCDYDGMHLATDLSDILFGTGVPVVTEANLGAIKADKVNIAVHGHNPLLSQIIVKAAREMEGEAKAAGAQGINIVGICCTGNEVLMREGVAIATNFSTQELAILTGAMEAMVVDVQCIMPSLRSLAQCYHTKIITTMPIMKIPGSYHFAFDEANAVESAKAIVRLAIEAYKTRDVAKVSIPDVRNKVVAGFSLESLLNIFRAINPDNPIKVLTDAIEAGQIKGVALFAGCNNLKGIHDHNHLTIAREMAKNDVFMVATGCAAQAFAKDGLLSWDGVEKYAGDGLKKFLQQLNEKAALKADLPLIFHMGSCVDNTRAADLATLIAKEMQADISDIPYVATAPEAMSEKAVSIGAWNVAMGVPVHVGVMPPVEGSDLVYGVVTQIAEDVFGGYFILEPNADKAVAKLVEVLDERTWKLRMRRKAAEQLQKSAN